MKTAIVYASVHHGNTEKVVKAMANTREITLIDITKEKDIDLSEFSNVGFASGIYRGLFHKKIIDFVKTYDFKNNPKVFTVCTCGAAYRNYSNIFKKILIEKNLDCIGSFCCRGYDTAVFKFMGGIAKGHPNASDLERAKKFISKTVK